MWMILKSNLLLIIITFLFFFFHSLRLFMEFSIIVGARFGFRFWCCFAEVIELLVISHRAF